MAKCYLLLQEPAVRVLLLPLPRQQVAPRLEAHLHRLPRHPVHVHVEKVEGLAHRVAPDGLSQLLHLDAVVLQKLVGQQFGFSGGYHHQLLDLGVLHVFLLANDPEKLWVHLYLSADFKRLHSKCKKMHTLYRYQRTEMHLKCTTKML